MWPTVGVGESNIQQRKNSQICNLYIGGVSPVPGAAVAKTPFTREGPMVSVSNLKENIKDIHKWMPLTS